MPSPESQRDASFKKYAICLQCAEDKKARSGKPASKSKLEHHKQRYLSGYLPPFAKA